MTYRVSRSASNYELQNDHPNGGSEPYLHHYVHNPAQSASVANIQQLATLQYMQRISSDASFLQVCLALLARQQGSSDPAGLLDHQWVTRFLSFLFFDVVIQSMLFLAASLD